MDQKQFENALDKVMNQAKIENGIGTLAEKTIHAVLKNYYATEEQYQEQKLGSYVADILINNHVIEIQSRNFNTLRRKLDAFLPMHEVTIVYPIAHTKWIRWIDEVSGEISPGRKSPKRGTIYQSFRELYRIKPYLTDKNLNLKLVLLDVEEYRLLNGWSKDKKKGSERNDGIPVSLVNEVDIKNIPDYQLFLPEQLPENFTVNDYKQLTRLSTHDAGIALNILNYLNVITHIGKKGRAYLYKRNDELT